MRLLIQSLAITLCICAQTLAAQSPDDPSAASEPVPVELQYNQTPKLLVPRQAIHADDDPEPDETSLTPIQKAVRMRDRIFDNMLSVTLRTVVNQSGRVVSVKAVAGPQRFFEQAEEIGRHRAYAPARVDGNVVRASFQDYVSIYPKERWGAQPVVFPAQADLHTLSVALQRTGCFGSCPGYTVTIDGSGEITFTSCDGCFVAIPGTHHARIPAEAVSDLLGRFRSANFLSALDSYSSNWTDMSSQTLTLSINGLEKQVYDYGGSGVGLPDAVEALEAAVDTTADTARWTVGNADTLPSLRKEKWNFSGGSSENIALFTSAIKHQNPELIQVFLAAKAPVVAADIKTLSPLCAASREGDRDLLQQMFVIQPKVKLPAEVTDECLSLAAHSGSVPVVQLWLSRGARTTFPAPSDEAADSVTSGIRRQVDPPLIAAIESGNLDVVALLLHAHADVSSKANSHHSLFALAFHVFPEENDDAPKRIFSMLLAAGADVNEEPEHDRPAIFEIGMHPSLLPLLLQAGAHVDQRDDEGKTSLILNSDTEGMVAALLEAGADPTLTTPKGTTALSEARTSRCTACVEMIETALKSRESATHATAVTP